MHVLIDLDAETHRRLERVAPAKSRKRSAFIRAAIQKALWELEEERTRRAYLEAPDSEPAPFDPSAWEPLPYGGFDPPRFERRHEESGGRATRKRSSEAARARATRRARTRPK